MTKLDIFKSVTGFVVGAGVSQIVAGVVDSLVPQETTIQKVVVFAGKTGISMVVGDVVKDHVGTKIDSAAAWVSSNVTVK